MKVIIIIKNYRYRLITWVDSIIHLSNIWVQFVNVVYLSNRPQVSMGYKLINHLGCW